MFLRIGEAGEVMDKLEDVARRGGERTSPVCGGEAERSSAFLPVILRRKHVRATEQEGRTSLFHEQE